MVSLHSRLMWSPTIRNISGITQKEPLGLLHRADHHTFPKCRILLKNILSFFFYGCRLNVKALMDEPTCCSSSSLCCIFVSLDATYNLLCGLVHLNHNYYSLDIYKDFMKMYCERVKDTSNDHGWRNAPMILLNN